MKKSICIAATIIFLPLYPMEESVIPNQKKRPSKEKCHQLLSMSEKETPIDKTTQWTDIPLETKLLILSLLDYLSPAEAIKGLKQLGLVSREFHDLVQDRLLLPMHIAAFVNTDRSRAENAFIKAAAAGDAPSVNCFKKHNVTIDTIQATRQTALFIAIVRGENKVVDYLLENETRCADSSYLIAACRTGNTAIIMTLIKSGALGIDQEKTKAFSAVLSGNLAALRKLIAKDKQVNLADQYGITLLMYAAAIGNLDLVKCLIGKHALVDVQDRDGQTALLYAVQHGHSAIVEFLIKKGADVEIKNSKRQSALSAAITQNDEKIASLLIYGRAKLNAVHSPYAMTPLMIAAELGYDKIVALLIKHKVAINTQTLNKQSALMLASQKGHATTVELLLKNGADAHAKTASGHTPLMLAAKEGRTKVVKALLGTTRNRGVMVSLVNAVKRSNDKENKHVDAKTTDGITALIYAVINGHKKIVKLLIAHHANINAITYNGWTPLMFAAEKGHADIVRLLLDGKAEVNIENCYGFTALMYAALSGRLESVQLLIDNNADVTAKSHNNKTALTIATSNGHEAIAKLLIEHGAK